MTKQEITLMQKRIGTEPDGFWGPKSIEQCKQFLRACMPSPNPWPKSDQASLTAFYGKPGDEDQLEGLDVSGLGVLYEGKPVKVIRCHRKVAHSLSRVLENLPPGILGKYDGCYNNRKMRGGSLPSLHARGAAIDFDAAHNGNKTHWPSVATMPLEVMIEFSREGWLSAGAFWSRDGMHFQATQ